ncbi:MAG: hypothetical protein EBR94_03115 [Bacteroidetes bacterium]|jgi:hypothetical protein|nr:hypothetical protein [Bacteroidota bacterium]
MKMKFAWNHNSSAALMALLFVALVNVLVGFSLLEPSGGQDSWNHYLYARWAPHHPELLLDQWGKPFFTFVAMPFALFGIKGVLLFNHLCVLATAWLVYLTSRRVGLKNPWLTIFLFAWQPIVLANVHSALTEPSNAMVLAFICYLFASNKWTSATVLASFLPMVRSEGFVLLLAVMLFLALRNRWKYMPLTIVGIVFYGLMGALVSGEWNWLIAHNPYIQQEVSGGFDAGHGDFWYYLSHQKEITGIIVTILCLVSLILILSYIGKRLQKKMPASNSQMALWLWLPLFGFFFVAHSILWWKGAMGSHGLLRVFVVVSPVAALLAMLALDKIMRIEIKALNRVLKSAIVLGMFFLSFPGAGLPYPWNANFTVDADFLEKTAGKPVADAIDWIHHSPYKDNVLAHQLPVVNVAENYDPWLAGEQLHPVSKNGDWMEPKKVSDWPKAARTLSLWSLDTKDSGTNDWFPTGTLVLWDNFHGRRDGQIDRNELSSLKKYSVVFQAGLNDADTCNDVIVLLKK